MTSYADAIGFAGAVLTTSAFAPQLWRTWRKGGDELSWTMLTMFGSGVGLWFLYGLVQRSRPIILANALTGVQILLILVIKLRSSQ